MAKIRGGGRGSGIVHGQGDVSKRVGGAGQGGSEKGQGSGKGQSSSSRGVRGEVVRGGSKRGIRGNRGGGVERGVQLGKNLVVHTINGLQMIWLMQ